MPWGIPFILRPPQQVAPIVNRIDRGRFYDSIRKPLFGGMVKPLQVQGMEFILDEWEEQQLEDRRWLAYMLATTFHETDKKMQPIEEYGKGRTKPYGRKIKHSGKHYTYPDKIYYGRGFVQLTWYENYELMSRLIYGDARLLLNPDLALDIKVATNILFEGMLRAASSFGDFTGKCLEMYFDNDTEDWKNARKIINGLDKADLIAGYGKQFYTALK